MKYTSLQIEQMLNSQGEQMDALLSEAESVKKSTIGDNIYLRGLIEYTNICRKNCFYCGIRRDNSRVVRYMLTDEQVLDAARFAYRSNYGSVVLQGGELDSEQHIANIERLVGEIKRLSDNKLGITLSFGEQTLDSYMRWRSAGAHRYLLRIESSTRSIYERIHPDDRKHTYDERLRALADLRKAGFQVGTGVMIGLPGQTSLDLANDILFMQKFDIDMCGMGPYVECEGTPLAENRENLMPQNWRLDMALKMIAVLRIVMPDINIAAATALQAIDPQGRMRAVNAGANIIMPNISPENLRSSYALYNNKPLSFDSKVIEDRVCYGEWGDSKHYLKSK